MKKNFAGKKSYAVFGMGEFGKSVALELAKTGADVMAIDSREDELAEIAEYVTEARVMDATDVRAYEKLGLSNMDAVVVAITGNMDATLMAILQAVEAEVSDIVVKALNDIQAKIFCKIGATQIITPEKSEGIRLARTLARSDIFEFIELRENICMLEISMKKEWINKTLVELNLRDRYRINVIAVVRNGAANMVVEPQTRLLENDHLVIVTDKKNIKKI
ncbi:MAG: TrkA family potassium uptake protein [Eubacteriales bacterium]|nr:TrkA family potassium uptake protein [Eubacteriales bacterium]